MKGLDMSLSSEQISKLKISVTASFSVSTSKLASLPVKVSAATVDLAGSLDLWEGHENIGNTDPFAILLNSIPHMKQSWLVPGAGPVSARFLGSPWWAINGVSEYEIKQFHGIATNWVSCTETVVNLTYSWQSFAAGEWHKMHIMVRKL